MTQQIVVGPMSKGLRNDVTPFNVDNESFPVLINAYQWRQRIKRKRGTKFINRLTRRPMGTAANSYRLSLGNTSAGGAINGNLVSLFSLESNASIKPDFLQFNIGAATIVDDGNGNLSGGGASGNINYSTGVFAITGAPAVTAAFVSFLYYPNIVTLGLEPFVSDASSTPLELGFDRYYSYNISLINYNVHDVSYYYNPTLGAKTNWTSFKWNLADYQQIWTTNFSGALWAVPGITDPYSADTVGMQFSPVTNVAAPVGQTVVITVTGNNLVVGDYVFLNEFSDAVVSGLNFQTGYITAGSAPGAITVTLPNATLGGAGGATTAGIVQYLTNTAFPTKDCIRWYNGAPVNYVNEATSPTFTLNQGWVNFSPPLTTSSVGTFSIGDLAPAQYYLVGARMVVPYKDRLLFFGPLVQSSTGSVQYLQDTIVYSQNGTPFYTATFAGSPSVTAAYTPLVVPANQTAQPSSWWENRPGYGGFISAGYSRPITSVSINEDALIVGLADRQTRVLYTSNDLIPFAFYVINSELGSDSTFSTVTLDRGVLSVGGRGIILTSQIQSQRVDLEIPDQVFQISLLDQGARRICAQRDFINEWVYFTYSSDEFFTKYPSQTLMYNYREDTWGLFNESYSTYGSVRFQTGSTWATLDAGLTWRSWRTPWNSGASQEGQPVVLGGNQQGFIIQRDDDTYEDPSLYIKSISGNVITSPDHGLTNDYVIISGCIGTVGQVLNGKVFSVLRLTDDTFEFGPGVSSGTYLGGGIITRLYRPFIQSKQFPVAWAMGRKTRLGPQLYLLSATPNSQITLLIYLSQDNSNPYNDPIPENDSLVYSAVLYTCPENSVIGLNQYTKNLQMVTAQRQAQIWHRMNTSLIGDTVQVGFTLSDDQMLEVVPETDSDGEEVSYAIAAATQANPCVLTTTANYAVGTLVKITGVVGMTQINFIEDPNYNYYEVITSNSTTTTINIDSTAFTAYSSGGTIVSMSPDYQTSEIELHAIILNVSPSQVLA